MLVRMPVSAACSRLIRCHASTRVANARSWQLVIRRSYATPGRPKKAVGETSKPVKRAAKPAASTAPAASKKVAAAKKPTAAKTVAKKSTKISPERKLAKKEAADKKKAALKEKADKKKAAQKEKLSKQKEAQKAKSLKQKEALKAKSLKQKASQKKVIATTKLAALKKAALERPKVSGTVSAYNVFVSQNTKGESASLEQSQNRMKDLAKQFQELGSQDREHYNHLANEQNASRDATLRDWTLTHSVEDIAAANSARRRLNKLYPKGKGSQDKYPLITDERAPKKPLGAYLQYFITRRASGDFRNIETKEVSKLIGQEWRNMGEGEKSKYQTIAQQESARYAAEAPRAAAAAA